jgi:hypothetical protein
MVSPLTRLGGLSSFLGVLMGLMFTIAVGVATALVSFLNWLFPVNPDGR